MRQLATLLVSLSPCLLCRRQRYVEGRAAADCAGSPDPSALHLDQPLDDRQAQAASAGLAGAGLVGTVEALEDPRQLVGRDAGAGVRNLEDDEGRRTKDQ